MALPDYINKRRLPKGGPDRFRFCLFYGNAVAEGRTHEQALNDAFGTLRLMYYYVAMGLADSLGETAGGVPLQYLGEDDTSTATPSRL